MQSWQADILNLYLSLSLKPMFRHVGSVDLLRKLIGVGDSVFGRLAIPRDTLREVADIPGAEFNAEWVANPSCRDDQVLLYLPGGAYVMRIPNLHVSMLSRLCQRAGLRALMAYYRLAPEHPFPACVEDSVLAYRWLLDQGYASTQIAIAGDSAGGGLCVSTLIKLRELGMPQPAAAFMMSPLLDVSDQAASRWKNARADAALPAPHRRAVNPRALYLGDNDPSDPIVSPINGNLQGLPPLYIQVSDSEMLLDDSLRLARRGHTFSVPVRVDVGRKLPHVWPLFAFLPEAQQSLEQAADFLTQHLTGDAHVPG